MPVNKTGQLPPLRRRGKGGRSAAGDEDVTSDDWLAGQAYAGRRESMQDLDKLVAQQRIHELLNESWRFHPCSSAPMQL